MAKDNFYILLMKLNTRFELSTILSYNKDQVKVDGALEDLKRRI